MNRALYRKLIKWNFIALFAIAGLSMLLGCTPKDHAKAKDGYYFEQPEFRRYEFPINVVVIDSQKKLEEMYFMKTGKKFDSTSRQLAAFSSLSYNRDTLAYECTMFIINPEERYVPEFIGHELTHCFYGQWHPTQP